MPEEGVLFTVELFRQDIYIVGVGVQFRRAGNIVGALWVLIKVPFDHVCRELWAYWLPLDGLIVTQPFGFTIPVDQKTTK